MTITPELMDVIESGANGAGLVALAAFLIALNKYHLSQIKASNAQARKDGLDREGRMAARINHLEDYIRTDLIKLTESVVRTNENVVRAMSHYTDALARMPCIYPNMANSFSEQEEKANG